jgi:sarcosine oxidase, subunit beta
MMEYLTMTDIRLKSHYDAIIIGAGSIGAPTAFYLAKSGVRTLVIDQYASVGQGSNKKAIGGIRATHSDPAKIALSLRSIEVFSHWKECYGDDIEWYQGGYVFVAYREQEEKSLKELLAIQKSYGLKIDWLNAYDLDALVPDLNKDGLMGGTYSSEDGNASPLLSNHAFYRHAVEAGADFHFNETVIDILVQHGRIVGLTTNKDTYFSDVVINAAGAWAKPISKIAHFDIPVVPDAHESAITEPVARFLTPMVVDIRPMPGSSNFYFYQHFTGQIVFCITPSPSIWGIHDEETSAFLPMVSKRMIDVMPRLANIRVRRTWRGLYPMTPDGFPIVGWVDEVPGYLLAAGMCGQGFMLGPGLGELLARLVCKTTTENDVMVLRYLSPYREFVGQEKLK